jgi:hypothetical protein
MYCPDIPFQVTVPLVRVSVRPVLLTTFAVRTAHQMLDTFVDGESEKYILLQSGVLVGVNVIVGVLVIDGVKVIVFVGVFDGVGVSVTVGVFVIVGVLVIDGVFVGVMLR